MERQFATYLVLCVVILCSSSSGMLIRVKAYSLITGDLTKQGKKNSKAPLQPIHKFTNGQKQQKEILDEAWELFERNYRKGKLPKKITDRLKSKLQEKN